MITITQYTREAQARREYKTLDNGDQQFFVIRINHNFSDSYRAVWEMITEEHHNGYNCTLTTPMADYNGRTTIKQGRFNRKWLEKADQLLQNKADQYFDLWKQEKYQELCNMIHEDIASM